MRRTRSAPRRLPAGTAPLALVALALAGPIAAGRPGVPAAAVEAAQSLPPGARVDEVALSGGGFVRAPRIEVDADGLTVETPRGVRRIAGLGARGPVRSRRLWLGTDGDGRDLAAAVTAGARTSVGVALIATALTLGFALVFGLASAASGARVRGLLGAAAAGLLGVPRLLLLLAAGLALRGVPWGVPVAIGLTGWVPLARLFEARAIDLGASPLDQSARMAGNSAPRRLARHWLPALAPLAAAATPMLVAEAMLLESTLAFLGIDAWPGAISWGRLVAGALPYFPDGWWIALFPGALLVLAVQVTLIPYEVPSQR